MPESVPDLELVKAELGRLGFPLKCQELKMKLNWQMVLGVWLNNDKVSKLDFWHLQVKYASAGVNLANVFTVNFGTGTHPERHYFV